MGGARWVFVVKLLVPATRQFRPHLTLVRSNVRSEIVLVSKHFIVRRRRRRRGRTSLAIERRGSGQQQNRRECNGASAARPIGLVRAPAQQGVVTVILAETSQITLSTNPA